MKTHDMSNFQMQIETWLNSQKKGQGIMTLVSCSCGLWWPKEKKEFQNHLKCNWFTGITKNLTSDVFSVLIFSTVYLTYLPRMPLKAEEALRCRRVCVICDLIAIYRSGEICLHFQIINLTETKWTDWFKPVSSQTPQHWETPSINRHNCFLWRVAGKTYSITFHRESSHTINCRLVHHTAWYWLGFGQSAQSKQYLSH